MWKRISLFHIPILKKETKSMAKKVIKKPIIKKSPKILTDERHKDKLNKTTLTSIPGFNTKPKRKTKHNNMPHFKWLQAIDYIIIIAVIMILYFSGIFIYNSYINHPQFNPNTITYSH
jgi:hypothetical protein